jgi:zinc transporter ZupT
MFGLIANREDGRTGTLHQATFPRIQVLLTAALVGVSYYIGALIG